MARQYVSRLGRGIDETGTLQYVSREGSGLNETVSAAPGTSKYLVKPIFTLPGGLIVPVGMGAYAARALRHNLTMTRRRAMSFFGWSGDE